MAHCPCPCGWHNVTCDVHLACESSFVHTVYVLASSLLFFAFEEVKPEAASDHEKQQTAKLEDMHVEVDLHEAASCELVAFLDKLFLPIGLAGV